MDSYRDYKLKSNNIAKIAYFLVPCHKLPNSTLKVGQECIADEEKQKAYLE